MGTCNINHSRQEVIQKLENQKTFLPSSLTIQLNQFLEKEHSQDTLNDLFHLLKKYDLAPEKEKLERNQKMQELTG